MTLSRTKRFPRIRSRFALLDVLSRKDGELYRRVEAGEKIPITIHGKIVGVFGGHDGISREYEIEVERLNAKSP